MLTLSVLTVANLNQNPFAAVQQFIANAAASRANMVPDVSDPEIAERVKSETLNAYDDLLAEITRNAVGLKGAPGKSG